jgi:hypothetical protein
VATLLRPRCCYTGIWGTCCWCTSRGTVPFSSDENRDSPFMTCRKNCGRGCGPRGRGRSSKLSALSQEITENRRFAYIPKSFTALPLRVVTVSSDRIPGRRYACPGLSYATLSASNNAKCGGLGFLLQRLFPFAAPWPSAGRGGAEAAKGKRPRGGLSHMRKDMCRLSAIRHTPEEAYEASGTVAIYYGLPGECIPPQRGEDGLDLWVQSRYKVAR